MSIPFSLGKILDIIYTRSDDNPDDAKSKLTTVCGVLMCVFVLGAICNFGRIYLMSVAGNYFLKCLIKNNKIDRF